MGVSWFSTRSRNHPSEWVWLEATFDIRFQVCSPTNPPPYVPRRIARSNDRRHPRYSKGAPQDREPVAATTSMTAPPDDLQAPRAMRWRPEQRRFLKTPRMRGAASARAPERGIARVHALLPPPKTGMRPKGQPPPSRSR